MTPATLPERLARAFEHAALGEPGPVSQEHLKLLLDLHSALYRLCYAAGQQADEYGIETGPIHAEVFELESGPSEATGFSFPGLAVYKN